MRNLFTLSTFTIFLMMGMSISEQAQAQSVQAPSQASIEYIGDWPTEAEVAFQHAADIWNQTLQPKSPIHIKAIWSASSSSGQPGTFGYFMEVSFNTYLGAPLHPITGPSYPKQLSNELLDKETDSGDAFSIQVNRNRNWYFGLDGNVSADQYDFVTLALRTIGLGLGFKSGVFLGVQEDIGGWGSAANPQFTTYYLFDHFLINNESQPLINNSSFPNHSKTFRDQLVDGEVFLKSELARAQNNGAYPAVDILDPSTAMSLDGANYFLTSFLNESAFPANTPDGLMTPSIERGESIHEIGPVTFAIMQEFGWASAPVILRDSLIFNIAGGNAQGFDLWSIVADPRFDDEELTISISNVADGTAGATVSGGRYLSTNAGWTGTITFSLNVENPDGKIATSTISISFVNLENKIYLPAIR